MVIPLPVTTDIFEGGAVVLTATAGVTVLTVRVAVLSAGGVTAFDATFAALIAGVEAFRAMVVAFTQTVIVLLVPGVNLVVHWSFMVPFTIGPFGVQTAGADFAVEAADGAFVE
jgi:predicted RNA methylase